MDFIETITEEMEKQGITAYKLCKDIGLSQQTFSNWKNGKMPSIDKAVKIIIYLGLSADEVFEINKSSIELSPEGRKLLEAYQRADAGTQKSVRKLLDIPENQSKSSGSQTGKIG